MSGSLHAWYSLRDLGALANRDVALGGEIRVDKLQRLASLVHSGEGSVKATLRFSQRRDGWLGADPPWFTLGEELGALIAPLIGAEPEAVVVTGATTVNQHALTATAGTAE